MNQPANSPNGKKVLTPAEFGQLFGRSKSWTYRNYYEGKISGITDFGKLMIPVSEADRIAGKAAVRRTITATTPAPKSIEAVSEGKKGSAEWFKQVMKRRVYRIHNGKSSTSVPKRSN